MLTKEEMAFLQSQGLDRKDVYDGRDQPAAERKAAAKAAGCRLILGAPCGVAAHRLRTRAGHCAQCDPKKLAYEKRYHSEGFVYIAGSKSARFFKIGTATEIAQRQRNLNNHRYGGFSDWKILFHARVTNGGESEQMALRALADHRVTLPYLKDGKDQDAQEVVKVRFAHALDALSTAIGTSLLEEPWMARDYRDYDPD